MPEPAPVTSATRAERSGESIPASLKDSQSPDVIRASAAGRRADDEADVSSELIGRAQRGDHEAFERLVRPAFDRLYAVARRILRDPDLAEDAVQTTLERAWRELRGLRDPDRFPAWLHRLLVNSCRDEARRVRRRPIEVPWLAIDRPAEGDAATTLAERDALERAFLRLSVEQRAALVLTHYVGLPAAEVAAVCGVPTGTIYSRLHTGAAAMRTASAAAPPATTAAPEHVR